MFEWMSGNLSEGDKTGLNVVWNIFCGSLIACVFAWPFAVIAGKDDPIKGLEFLFKPFG